jgi:hypothetical protein
VGRSARCSAASPAIASWSPAVALLRRFGLADFVVIDEVEKMRDYFHPA